MNGTNYNGDDDDNDDDDELPQPNDQLPGSRQVRQTAAIRTRKGCNPCRT